MGWAKWIAACALWALTAAAPAAAAQRLALVIGNDAYQSVEPLRKAVADARAYRDHLRDVRGFDQVFYAEDADHRTMLDVVGRFLTAIEPGDTVFVVYSGHGVQLDPNRSDTLYLLPTSVPKLQPEDAAAQFVLGASAVQFSTLRDEVVARGARTRVFVLDACRDNPFGAARVGGRSVSVGLARGLAAVQAADGEFIFYAAAPGAQALDRLSDRDPHPNSVFSRVFLEHFRPGVYLEDLANEVQRGVYDLAGTARPAFVQRPYYDDGVIGKGCLEDRCGATAPPPPPGGDAEARAAFEAARALDDPDLLDVVAERYPGTVWADLAKAAADKLRRAAAAAPKGAAKAPAASPLVPPAAEAAAPSAVDPAADPAALAAAAQLQLWKDGQDELRRLGLYTGATDGAWGRGSERAMRAAQRALGLPEDGVITPASLDRLRRASVADVRPPAPAAGAAIRDCDACPEMVALPGGTYTMGSPPNEPGRDGDEGPQQRVTIRAFAMGRTEVTFAMWDACAADGYCTSNPQPDDRGWGRGDRPVINVSWNDVAGERGFLAWLNSRPGVRGAPYRLPSEAEWEYAARAGTETAYSFGADAARLGEYGWYSENSGGRTQPVGGKQANPFGLSDMHGNVWEWV